MFDPNALWVLAAVFFGGSVGLGLSGVAVHHGLVSAIGMFLAAVLGGWLRDVVFSRLRRDPKSKRGFWAAVASGFFIAGRSVLRAIAIPMAGYAWAHALRSFPTPVVLAFPFVIFAGLVWAMRRQGFRNLGEWRLPSSLAQWLRLQRQFETPSVGHLIWLSAAAWWPPPQDSWKTIAADTSALGRARVQLQTLRWIDTPARGLRNAVLPTRAVALVSEQGAPSDVYLLHVSFSHFGHPTRITSAYNLSQTASVEEADLQVWQRWASWSIRHGEQTQSIEVADFRSAPAGRGEGWDRLKRWQQAITNRQQTGQWRGIARSTIKLSKPSSSLSVKLDEQGLTATVDSGEIHMDLGRVPTEEQFGDLAVFGTSPTPLPGSLVPWAVDRVRALPWIGSEGMQKVKGWAFRASEQLEELENEVVGINPDEVIAEELGDILETLPLATPGEIPGWPPQAIEPVLKPAMAGEGRWVSLAADVVAAGTPGTPSPFVFTFIRVDEKRAYIQTSITLWDPRQVALHVVAGTEEPKSMTGEQGSGMIPRDPKVLGKLVGAFNGAFQAMHGEFGMMESGRVQLPPKPYGATVATFTDGTAGFGTWPESAPIPDEMVGLRQNMTPLVVDGQFNPYRRSWWGGVPEGWTQETRTVRSGLCLTFEGYLAYFYSPGIDPEGLGKAMIQARCDYGFHLDMNAGHTGFEFYRVEPAGKLPSLDRPLDATWESRGEVSSVEGLEFLSRLMVRKMPLMNFPRYIHVSARDFFYLTRRALLPGPPLKPLIEGVPDDGMWRVAGADDNGWPHVIARTGLHGPGFGDEPSLFLITRIDPKQLRRVESKDEASLGLQWPDPGEGAQVLSLNGNQLQLGVARTPGHTLGWGHPEPTPEGAAACIDGDGLLVLLQRDKIGTTDVRALTLAVQAAGCRQTIYLDKPVVIAATAESRETLSEEAASSATTKTVNSSTAADGGVAGAAVLSWFARSTMAGAHRIFKQTPIVGPNDWALLQKRRVPYTGRTTAP